MEDRRYVICPPDSLCPGLMLAVKVPAAEKNRQRYNWGKVQVN